MALPVVHSDKQIAAIHIWWCHNSFNILWSSCSTVWGQEGVCFQAKNLLILSGVYKKAIHISLCTIQCAVQWEPIHDPLIYHTPLSRTDPSSICRPCSYTLQIKTYLLFFLPQLQVAVFIGSKNHSNPNILVIIKWASAPASMCHCFLIRKLPKWWIPSRKICCDSNIIKIPAGTYTPTCFIECETACI